MGKIQVIVNIAKNDISLICTETSDLKTRVLFSDNKKGLFIKNKKLHDVDAIGDFIQRSKSDVELILGYEIHKMHLGIEDHDIRIQRTKKTIVVANKNKIVQQREVDSLKKLSTEVIKEKDYQKIFHQPFRYVIDGKNIVDNPIGKKADTLTVDMLVYKVSDTLVQSIKVLELLIGHIFESIIPSSFGLANEAASTTEMMNGVTIAQINYSSTTLYKFKRGCLIKVGNVKKGFNSIINIIAIKLRVDKKVAFDFYNKVAIALSRTFNRQVVHTSFDDKSQKLIRHTNYDVALIAENQIINIYKDIVEEMKLFSPNETNVICTGLLSDNKTCSMLLERIGNNIEIRNYTPNILGAAKQEFTTPLGLSYYNSKNSLTTPEDLLINISKEKINPNRRIKLNAFLKRIVGIN